MIPANGAPHDLEARDVHRSLAFAKRRALRLTPGYLLPPLPSVAAGRRSRHEPAPPRQSIALLLACPNSLGLEQLAVLSPPPSAHSVSGHVYTSALSEDASLHQQRHAKKVCLAAAYRKSSCTAYSPQYPSTRIYPEELRIA